MTAKLNFIDVGSPGITRRIARGKWQYFLSDGTRLSAPDEIARLNAIALPPAYKDAWYSDDPRAHIQATGIDTKGRKQYRYHPEFRAFREGRAVSNSAGYCRC